MLGDLDVAFDLKRRIDGDRHRYTPRVSATDAHEPKERREETRRANSKMTISFTVHSHGNSKANRAVGKTSRKSLEDLVPKRGFEPPRPCDH
jgi:hypothetical protein